MPYMTKSTDTSIIGASILSGQVFSRRVFSGQVFSGAALGDDNSPSKWVIIGWKGGGASRTWPYFNAHFDPSSRLRGSKIAKHHHDHFKGRSAFFCMQFSHVKNWRWVPMQFGTLYDYGVMARLRNIVIIISKADRRLWFGNWGSWRPSVSPMSSTALGADSHV